MHLEDTFIISNWITAKHLISSCIKGESKTRLCCQGNALPGASETVSVFFFLRIAHKNVSYLTDITGICVLRYHTCLWQPKALSKVKNEFDRRALLFGQSEDCRSDCCLSVILSIWVHFECCWLLWKPEFLERAQTNSLGCSFSGGMSLLRALSGQILYFCLFLSSPQNNYLCLECADDY